MFSRTSQSEDFQEWSPPVLFNQLIWSKSESRFFPEITQDRSLVHFKLLKISGKMKVELLVSTKGKYFDESH